jgi:hypothetical protein
MDGDSLRHLGVAGFGGRAIRAAGGGALNEPLGMAALARPGTAQN